MIEFLIQSSVDDPSKAVLREWLEPLPVYGSPAATEDTPAEAEEATKHWTVTSTTSAVDAHLAAWTGDITLLPFDSQTDYLIAELKLGVWTFRAFHSL